MSLKEDEKEVLAHIVQNIDEQEIFLEFVAKAETIKEAWQIAKIFENKKKEFADNLQEYDMLIKAKEKELKNITAEIAEANMLLKEANDKLESIRSQFEEMQSSFMLVKDDNESNLLDFSGIISDFQPLNAVRVHVKNGATAMARAAQTIYSPELYEVYRRAGKRLFRLKDKIGELELKNEKLRVELRDLTEEDNFKDNMLSKMGDIHDDYNPIATPKIPIQSFEQTDNFDIEAQADRMAQIEKKKEKVEEMLNQLSNVLREEGINTGYTDEFTQTINSRNK